MAKSNIHALRQRKIDVTKEQRTLLDKAAAEDGRELSEIEAAKFDDNIKVLTSLEKSIEREERVMELERGMTAVSDDNTDAAARGGAPTDAAKPFKTFGEQLSAIMVAGRSDNRMVDPRLLKLNAAASGMNEAVPSDGGFAVQTDFESGILTQMHDLGKILAEVRHTPIGPNSNGLKINAVDETSRATGSRWGGVRTYWANEADASTATKPKFRRMELELNKLFGLFYVTDELVQDAAALGSLAETAFAEELTFAVEDAIWEGDGSGKPKGVMNAACLVTVSKETSQASTTLVSENVLKMNSRLPARSQASAKWYVNVDVLPQLPQLNIKIKNVAGTENVGGIATPIYQFPQNGGAGSILGKPVIPVEYASSLGTLGDIGLFDFTQYLLIEKGGVQAASSMHVRFLNDEMVFRVTLRCDGQSIWSSALTPFKGSNTQSPFVTLQAR